MRILQLHNHHQSLGGAMEVLAHEALMLASSGHHVREYTLPASKELNLSQIRAGAKAVWNVQACRAVEGEIRAFRPDIVHVHTPFPLLSPAVFRTASRMGVPSVTTLHSYRYSCIKATCYRKGAVCEDCVGKVFKLAGLRHRCYHDSVGASGALTLSLALHRSIGTFHQSVGRFIALTDFSKRLLIRDGIAADQIVVKPNSVPDPGVTAAIPPDERYVAFVGRLIDIKGVETMLAAWSRANRGDLKLRIAGDGPLRSLVEERARVDPSLSYEGWLSEGDVFDLMRGAMAVLVPSEWYEAGQPLVTLRSLAVGTPVITSDLENISADLLADDAGVAFKVGDSSALAAIIGELARDPQGWQARRERARRSYDKRYSPQVDLPRLEAVYRDLLEAGPTAARRRGA